MNFNVGDLVRCSAYLKSSGDDSSLNGAGAGFKPGDVFTISRFSNSDYGSKLKKGRIVWGNNHNRCGVFEYALELVDKPELTNYQIC